MIRLQLILDEWKKDSVIDKILLDESSLVTPNLHSKYLQHLMDAKKQLRSLNAQKRTFKATERRNNIDYQNIEEMHSETEDIITACESILTGIKDRMWSIKHTIDWRRFVNGSDV